MGPGPVIAVMSPYRGHVAGGLGSRLLDALETHARAHQVTTLRLDTRRDLVEARRLYTRHGYTEVRPFSHGPYSDHWYEKAIRSA